MITKSGKIYEIYHGQNSGGVTSLVEWFIASQTELSAEEVDEIIEFKYPFAGYGASGYRRLPFNHAENKFKIKVTSHASCD